MKIKKILKVVDTREYELIGDKCVVVAGSGTENECARCRRTHFVHAYVELDDGSTAVVGTGCMKEESTEVQTHAKKLASQAKRLATLKAKLANLVKRQELRNSIKERVAKMCVPKIVITEGRRYWCENAVIATCGDVVVWDTKEMFLRLIGEDDLRRRAIRQWQEAREKELGGGFYLNHYEIDHIKQKIRKLGGEP